MQQKTTLFPNYFLLLVFALLSVVGIAHHSMWLDEVNCWLMVRTSHSLKDLSELNHYNGYLSLWEFLLYGLSRFTGNILYVQVLNILISISAAYLFIWHAPFSFVQKICILFSYFFLFEYTIISRSYALSWLFLVIFCILFTQKKRNYTAIIFSLLLLSATHFLSLITSIPLFLITFYFMKIKDGVKTSSLISLCLIFTGGIMVSVFNMVPPENAAILQVKDPYFTNDHVSKALSYFVKGLYPLPDFMSSHFWNSNFIVVHIKLLSILLTIFILVICYFIFSKKYLILMFFYAANLGIILALFALKITVGTRYMGYCFMILLVSLWLATDECFSLEPPLAKKWVPAAPQNTRFIIHSFLWSIFLIQLIAGIYTFTVCLNRPFSEGKNAADYIKDNLPLHSNIIVAPTPSGPAIAACLTRKIYYPQTNASGSFYSWEILPGINNRELTQRIFASINKDSSRYAAIVISRRNDSFPNINKLIESTVKTGYSLYKEVTMDNGIVQSENYAIYLIRKK